MNTRKKRARVEPKAPLKPVEPLEPEERLLPTTGSAGEERLREADAIEGKAPPREGAHMKNPRDSTRRET
jgi:hypothetical protein